MPADQGQAELNVLSQLMFLDRGLHLFRIAEAHVSQAAFLGLSATPVGLGKVDFFPGENVTDLTLRKAGDCIVVRVSGDKAGVLVTEYKLSGSVGEIKLRIDRVATQFTPQGAAAPAQPSPAASSPAASSALQKSLSAGIASPISVKILGHISGRGDVIASDDWIGDPGGAAPLEGFAIKVIGLPPDVKMVYSCQSGAGRKIQTGEAGEFVGSRGNGNKINSITFSLEGPGSKNYVLTGQAKFSKAGHMDISAGNMLGVKNPQDALVALRLFVAPRENPSSEANAEPAGREKRVGSKATPPKKRIGK